MMPRLIVHWQHGPWSHGPSLQCLNLSIRLMQRILPAAELHVTTQAPIQKLPGVEYHYQQSLYSMGRFHCPQWPANAHVLYLENDHVMWAIPPGMSRWLERTDATLAWIIDWAYNADEYAERVGDFLACPGMYGLKPGDRMEPHGHSGEGIDLLEMGYIALWLKEHGPHEFITTEAVTAYMPNHPILGESHRRLGTCGTHFPGLNRGWSQGGEMMISELEKRYL